MSTPPSSTTLSISPAVGGSVVHAKAGADRLTGIVPDGAYVAPVFDEILRGLTAAGHAVCTPRQRASAVADLQGYHEAHHCHTITLHSC